MAKTTLYIDKYVLVLVIDRCWARLLRKLVLWRLVPVHV